MAPRFEIGQRLVQELINMSPIIMNGAGLSSGLVPTTKQLNAQFPGILKELMELSDQIRNELEGVEAVEGDFYKRARRVVECLKKNMGDCKFDRITDSPLRAKAQLLNCMDFRKNQAWLGKFDVDIMRNFSRYRVIARLAKEECWSSIFTTNWDCFLEDALSQIGMEPKYGQITPSLTPWKNCYAPYLHHGQESASQHKVIIYKINGCAKELNEGFKEYDEDPDRLTKAVSRFMILDNEITELIDREKDSFPNRQSPTDQALMDKFRDGLRTYPFWIMGHSLNDSYLIRQIEDAQPVNTHLTVMDVKWDDKHDAVLTCFKKTKDQCFFELAEKEPWPWDKSLLWLQTMYGLERLNEYLAGHPDQDAQDMCRGVANLVENLKDGDRLKEDKLLFSFFDSFLPAWMRIVWSSGMVECLNYCNFSIEDIWMQAPNYYIPFQTGGLPRLDLVSAAQILLQLNGQVSGNLERFPGGVLNERDSRLFLPIPIRAGDTGNHLQGFETHIEALRNERSFANQVSIVPVNLDTIDPHFDLNDEIKKKIEKSFSSRWGISFEGKIDFKTLDGLIL